MPSESIAIMLRLRQQDQLNREYEPAANLLTQRLGGILLPFPTPFNMKGEIDERALRLNIERWNTTGIKGYVALGSTGERVHLSESEYLSVIEGARTAVPENLAFIVGAGQQSVRASVEEIRRAARAGADAVLVITPHFYRRSMTQSALEKFYLSVADASPVPVMLYSMPDLTGVAIAPETVARLGQHENILGIKDSSADIVNFSETLRLVPEDFAVVTGNGPLLYAALSAGARGAILAVGCVAYEQSLAIYDAVMNGEHERARAIQRKLTPLARAVTVRYGIGGLKAALDMIGFSGGVVRAPLEMPYEEALGEISRVLDEAALDDEEHARY